MENNDLNNLRKLEDNVLNPKEGLMRKAIRKAEGENPDTLDECIVNMADKIANLVVNAREAKRIHPIFEGILKSYGMEYPDNFQGAPCGERDDCKGCESHFRQSQQEFCDNGLIKWYEVPCCEKGFELDEESKCVHTQYPSDINSKI